MRTNSGVARRRALVPVFLALVCSSHLAAQTPLTTVRVANGLVRPTFVTHAPGDFQRVFVTEQPGRVRIIKDGVLQATPFLDFISAVGDADNEQGLLGLAFHPDYASNGFFYVSYTNNNGNSVIRRYSVSADPDLADSDSFVRVLLISQPDGNHNGGWIAFGPDDYMYFALGDGGGSCDVGENAQDPLLLLGKMLRLDIDGDDFPADAQTNYAVPADNPFVGNAAFRSEIWAWGLRNPWRNAFDRETGDLYIADVGQGAREEINFQPASSTGGENYGWDCREGTLCSSASGCNTVGCNCADGSLVDPFHETSHPTNCSITGGVVYRGCAIPDLQGTYFFADFCANTIFSLRYDGATLSDLTNRTAELDPAGALAIDQITSFGEDAYGEVYICDRGGEIFKIVPAGGIVGADCNGNAVDDACEIAAGLPDSDGDGIPNVCDCDGDADGDSDVDLDDLLLVLGNFGSGAGGDVDNDGDTDLDDLLLTLGNFGATCV